MSLSSNKPKQFVVVGIGNIGKKFALTRHNMGFLAVDAMANRYRWSWREESRFAASVTRGIIEDGTIVHLIKPSTYVNESGTALRRYIDYFGLNAQDVVVVSDDVALPFGQLRLREKGSAGGHNGLKSIERCLGTTDYVRLRLGIGQQGSEQALTQHVLGVLSESEQRELPNFLLRVLEALTWFLTEEISLVMGKVNAKEQLIKAEPETSLSRSNTKTPKEG